MLRWIRPQLNENARAKALAAISHAERDRYDATPEAQRESFLAGRLVLRRLTSELLGTEPELVDLVAVCPDCGGPHGRPVIPGSNLHLSLSRSDDAVVAAASWDAPVGVDLERLDQPAATLAAIGAIGGEESVLRWTRIEAILKADGRGLRVDPAQVSFATVDGELEGWVQGSAERYRLSEVELAADVRVSVAVGALRQPRHRSAE